LKNMKKWLYLLLGSVSLVVGVAGAFIPVLPTTPFLLVASFCYLRSSTRMYRWLMGHRVLGPYIVSYTVYKGVSRQNKIGSLVFLWCSLLLSIFLVCSLFVTLILLVVGTAVTIHILKLKTLTGKQQEEIQSMLKRDFQ